MRKSSSNLGLAGLILAGAILETPNLQAKDYEPRPKNKEKTIKLTKTNDEILLDIMRLDLELKLVDKPYSEKEKRPWIDTEKIRLYFTKKDIDQKFITGQPLRLNY